MSASATERQELLALYANLRVTDVRDGMDTLLLHHTGSMGPDIRPLFRTRAFGIARTCRYLPFDQRIPEMPPEEYLAWCGAYYREVCPYPWEKDIEDGDVVVIDQSGVCCGLMGSHNSLGCFKAGARGIVTNGGVRDTDEIILQRIPFWSASVAQTMVQGRLRYDTKDVPVSVGGVTVHPGDVIVADGDGVIVVPRAVARDVARHAHAEHQRDIQSRRALYSALGMPPDASVEEY